MKPVREIIDWLLMYDGIEGFKDSYKFEQDFIKMMSEENKSKIKRRIYLDTDCNYYCQEWNETYSEWQNMKYIVYDRNEVYDMGAIFTDIKEAENFMEQHKPKTNPTPIVVKEYNY